MRTADDIVRTEVHYCVSFLISTLASHSYTEHGDLLELCEQACELSAPVDDYEEAAIQGGWSPQDSDTAQEYCESEGLEPYAREVFEHWIVSDWLAAQLAKRGEKVDADIGGMTVWARTTTGQGIAADSVIQQIASELNAQ